MTCKQTADLVTDYLEGALTPEVRRQVEEHLSTCKDCPAYFEQMRTFVRTLPAAKQEAVPTDIPAALLEAFMREKRPAKDRWLGIPRRIAVSLSVLIALLAIIWLATKLARHHGLEPNTSPSHNYQLAVLDLRKWQLFRGENNPSYAPLQLQRERLAITILLPTGREPASYEVTVSHAAGQVLIRTTGDGRFEDHTTVLHVKVDLTALPAGMYQLGIRQQGWDWTYYPLLLK